MAIPGEKDPKRVLELAQEVHDRYVNEGLAQQAQLIAAGEKEHARLVYEAKQESADVVSDALAEKSRLEGDIERLRKFEAVYRASLEKLVGFASESLSLTIDLDNTDTVLDEDPSEVKEDASTDTVESVDDVVAGNDGSISEESLDTVISEELLDGSDLASEDSVPVDNYDFNSDGSIEEASVEPDSDSTETPKQSYNL